MVQDSGLIGISCTSYTSDKAMQVIDQLKYLNIPIVWGGIHATFNPEECLKYADVVCVGEGEEAMLELVEKLEKKKDIRRIKNLWSRKKGKIYKNDVRPLIENLDDLPFEDYDLENQWVLENGQITRMEEKHLGKGEFNSIMLYKPKKFYPLEIPSRIMLLHTSRGCPYSCTFCCNYNLKKIYYNKGTFVRKRSIKNVIKQLQELKQRFQSIDMIWFTDDSFFIRSVEELKLFQKEYRKKINLPFICYVDPLSFNEEKLKVLIDSGLIRLDIGIQSGSEELNKNIYNRNISNEQLINMSRILSKYKQKMAPPEYQIIISNPYETEEDILSTIELLRKLSKPYYLQVFGLIFFPGTHLFYKALNDGIIKSKRDTCYNINYVSYSENINIKSGRLDSVYLNLILRLMQGNVKSLKYGSLPIPILRLLINRSIIRFFNKFESVTKILIKIPALIFKY